jgi:hypothetical protein
MNNFWEDLMLEDTLKHIKLDLKERRAKRFMDYINELSGGKGVFLDFKTGIARIGDRKMPLEAYQRIQQVYIEEGEGTIPFKYVKETIEDYLRWDENGF